MFLALCFPSARKIVFAGWFWESAFRDIFIFTPFVHGLFIGPALFFICKPNLITGFKKMRCIFIPGVLYLLWCIVVSSLQISWCCIILFLMNGDTDPDFEKLGISKNKHHCLFNKRVYGITASTGNVVWNPVCWNGKPALYVIFNNLYGVNNCCHCCKVVSFISGSKN